jgi:hypothetical protein
MVDFQNLFNPVLIILVIIFTGFSIYVYRTTNPSIPGGIKKILIIIRSLALALLLFAIFNAVIGFSRTDSKTRVNLFFLDNSKSIVLKDSSARAELVSKFKTDFSNAAENNFFSFGSGIEPLNNSELGFNQPYTNFEDIERYLSKQNSDIASITILSDGIITDGANPLYGFEKLSIPVFTVGIGDSTEQSDILLQEPQYNETIYRGHNTLIETRILNKNFSGRNVTLKLFENNSLVEQKNIALGSSGIDNVSFGYTPKSTGEKRLTILASPLKEENNINNNSKSFIIKVLNDKIKTFLISGSPSPDVAVFSNILAKNERIKFKSVVELGNSRQIKGGSANFPIDSTDLFILLNYPAPGSNNDLFAQIKYRLIEKHKPFIISLGSGINSTKLRELSAILPFTFEDFSNEEIPIEVYPAGTDNSLLGHSDIPLWEQLPPVTQVKSRIEPKKESEILVKAKMKNIQTASPVILSRQMSGYKSVAVIAGNIWKWGLQSSSKLEYLFDNFLSNSIQWLNTPAEKKLFSIKSAKKVYALGEKIEITASLYDDLLNPVENADVSLDVVSAENSYKTVLPYAGNGVYKTEIENSKAGNLKITGNVKISNKSLSDSLNLYVDKSDIERMNTRMDAGFLRQIAKSTNGSFFLINNYSGLKEKLNKSAEIKNAKREKSFEIRFASNEIILIIIILLFTIEWVIRKIYRLS